MPPPMHSITLILLLVLSPWTTTTTSAILTTLSKSPLLRRQTESHSGNSTVYYYAKGRNDGVGRQVLRYFILDALAHFKGGLVGGCCRYNTPDYAKTSVKQAHALMNLFGLTFRDACPTSSGIEEGEHVSLRPKDLKSRLERLFTTEWLVSLRSRVVLPTNSTSSGNETANEDVFRVAVHLRRGDVTLCRHSSRYLPNALFTKILDDFLPQYCGGSQKRRCEVTIYSQNMSNTSDDIEDFSVFLDRGYSLHLDGQVAQVWRAFVEADLLVLGKSAFSYVPALLNAHGTVIQPSHEGFPTLPGWTTLNDDSPYMVTAKMAREQLLAESCQDDHKKMI